MPTYRVSVIATGRFTNDDGSVYEHDYEALPVVEASDEESGGDEALQVLRTDPEFLESVGGELRNAWVACVWPWSDERQRKCELAASQAFSDLLGIPPRCKED